jgi:DNA-binding transcriptional LysR family regulator
MHFPTVLFICKIHNTEEINSKKRLIHQMDLHQIRVFQAAAQTGNFTRASAILHLSQSTISQHIKQLERELDNQLFLRVGRRVLLTDAGKVLLEHCEKILGDLRSARTALREHGEMGRGHLKLGTGVTALTYVLPPVLKKFKAKYPGIDLSIVTNTTAVITQLVKKQTIDIGIVTMPIEDKDLKVKSLTKEELLVVTERKKAVPCRKVISVDDLTKSPFILYEKGTALREVADNLFEKLGVSIRPSMEIGNVEATKSLVEAGLAASILPYNSVRREGEEGRLCLMRVKDHKVFRQLGLVTLRTNILPRAVSEMAKLIISELNH